MINVWGMVTRGTKTAGVQGPEHAIDVATALRLYTMGTAALNHEADRLGSIAVGKRQFANRWVGILHTCLQHSQLYDETAAWDHRQAAAA